MDMKNIILSCIALIIFGACSSSKKAASSLDDKVWIDLSYTFDTNTPYWPNNPRGFEHNTDAEGVTPLGYYYSSYSVFAPEHGGTHLDAPIHFAKGALTLDQLPLTSLTGNAVLIDVSEKALKNRDYLVTVADIEAWEKRNGKIPANTIILFRTGYGKFYPDRASYFGTPKTGAEALPELHFPGSPRRLRSGWWTIGTSRPWGWIRRAWTTDSPRISRRTRYSWERTSLVSRTSPT